MKTNLRLDRDRVFNITDVIIITPPREVLSTLWLSALALIARCISHGLLCAL